MKHITLGLTVAALWAVLATPAHAQSSVSDKIRDALQQTYRSDANRALDRSRNPVAAMIFCRLKDEMKVIVLAPGHGCYTELPGAGDELRYEVGRRTVRGNTDRFTLMFQKPGG